MDALPVQAKVAFGMDTLTSLCSGFESDGAHVSELNFGNAVNSTRELFSLRIHCAPVLSADTSESITNGTTQLTVTSRPHAMQWMEGNLKGQFNITVQPADVGGTQIDPEDIVKTNEDGSLVIKRRFQEFYVVLSLGDAETDEQSTHWVARYIFELNGKGQPVLGQDHFTGIASPEALALSIGGSAGDYDSGLVVVQSIKSTLNACIFLNDFKEAEICASKADMRKLVIKVGPEFQPSLVTELGFEHNQPPTNNPISWYDHRVDFMRVMSELISNSSALSSQYMLPEPLVKAWVSDAKTALSQVDATGSQAPTLRIH